MQDPEHMFKTLSTWIQAIARIANGVSINIILLKGMSSYPTRKPAQGLLHFAIGDWSDNVSNDHV